MRLFYAGISLLSAVTVMADTEIVNFRLPLTTASLAPRCVDCWNATSSFRHRLGLDIPSLMLNMSSNDDEKHILLGDLQQYSAWTARLSWPGSSPTKFEVEVHPHGDSMDEAVLHISAKPLSPPHPHPYLPLITSFLPLIITQLLFTPVTRTSPSSSSASRPEGHFSTAVQVILEPLEYGLVPRTAVSTIYWIIGAIILGLLGTPYVIKYMEMQMACDDKGRFTYERREVRQGEAKEVENEQEAVQIDEVDKAIGDARQRIGREQVS